MYMDVAFENWWKYVIQETEARDQARHAHHACTQTNWLTTDRAITQTEEEDEEPQHKATKQANKMSLPYWSSSQIRYTPIMGAPPKGCMCIIWKECVWLMSDRAGTMFVKRNDWHTLSHTNQVGVVRCCPLPARPYVLLIIVRVLFPMPFWYPCFRTSPSSSCSSYCSLRCSSCCSSFSHRRPSAAKYREGRPKCNWHLNMSNNWSHNRWE